MGKKLAAIALVCTLLAACTTNDTKSTAGEAYGPIDGPFRGRWWSYYERGVSSLAVGSTTLAEEDLRAALAGRSRDAWSARTYGLHFVEYFPNRELGVLYYKKEQYDEAEKYLKASLEAVDTERSRYYLDLITKARIAKGQLNDGSAPTALASSGSVLVASRTVPVDITAQDDIGVSAVRLNGELLPQRGSEKEVTFHQGLTLDEGEHALAVSTTDLADKTTESAINVVVDMTAPAIGIFSPGADAVTQASSVTLRGAAADKHGVIQVSILDGKVLAESTNGERRLDFSTELALQDGANRFIVVAKDKAGNEIRTAVDVFKGQPASAGAKLWKLQQIRPDLLQVAPPTTDWILLDKLV